MGRSVKWDSVRKQILGRDSGLCVRCGREAADVHHRKPKQMGGTSDETTAYGAANLISVCRTCHNHIHAHPSQSYTQGFLVHSWDDPAGKPVELNAHTLTFLEDGTVLKGAKPCDPCF